MNFDEDFRRQWEINIYHNLGFLCDGYNIQETDHGFKNETREVTSIELDFWNRCAKTTPIFPKIKIQDSINLFGLLDKIPFEDFEKNSLNAKFMWLENNYEIALCYKDLAGLWKIAYTDYYKVRNYEEII